MPARGRHQVPLQRGSENQACQPKAATEYPAVSTAYLLAPAMPMAHNSLVDKLDALGWPLSLKQTLSITPCPQEMPKLDSRWSTGCLHKRQEPAAPDPTSLCPDHLAQVGEGVVFTEQSG